MGMLLSSYLAPLRFSFDILGTKASLSLSSERMPKLQADEELMENAPVLDVGCDFTKGRDIANREQFTDLAKCIRQGGEPEVTGVHGVRALAIMRAMLRSHAERRLVSLEEILEND
jgi:predicted dehydrogenase